MVRSARTSMRCSNWLCCVRCTDWRSGYTRLTIEDDIEQHFSNDKRRKMASTDVDRDDRVRNDVVRIAVDVVVVCIIIN
jgi:hypothetical protein